VSGWRRFSISVVLVGVATLSALLGFVYTLPVIAAIVTKRKGPPPVLIAVARPTASVH
jgi:hypothetical protein